MRDLLDRATERLSAAGVPSPRHDAQVLFEHATGLTRTQLLTMRPSGPTVPGVETFEQYVERRCRREPLQHITGWAAFRHTQLAVGPGVFVPRPETELVAGEAVHEAQRLMASGGAATVVDLCTGSGAIALAVATEVPGARVHAVELDEAAHAWATRNLRDTGVGGADVGGTAVDLRRGDMADAFPELDGSVDVVVSNPPYIPVDAVIRDPEVAAHDPALALWSGSDGLDALRVVARAAARLLRPGGLLVAEHADLQGESAPEVLRQSPAWDAVTDHPDLAGRPRYVTARRRASR